MALQVIPMSLAFADNIFGTQFSLISIDENELANLLECDLKEEPVERDNGLLEQQQQQPSQLYQSQFVESYDSLNFYPTIQCKFRNILSLIKPN